MAETDPRIDIENDGAREDQGSQRVLVAVRRRSMWEDPRVRSLGALAGILGVVVLLTIAIGLYFGFLFDGTPQTRDQAALINWKAVATAPGGTVDQQQSYALALIQARDFPAAEKVIETIEARDDYEKERTETPLFLRGELQRAKGDLSAALATYTEAMDRMRSAYEKKFEEGGESNWAVAFGLHENYYLSTLARGAILQEQGDQAGAIEMYDIYLEGNPPEANILVKRGDAKAATGDTAGAAEDYREALRFLPDMQVAIDGLEKIGAER